MYTYGYMEEANKPSGSPETFAWEDIVRNVDQARTNFRGICMRLKELGFIIDTKTKILEVGSGRGVFARYLVDSGYDIIAVDINPRGDTSIPVAKASIEALPFDESDSLQRFDLIAGFGLIDPDVYEQDIKKIFSEMSRVLEIGGYVYLSPILNVTKRELELSLPATLKLVVSEPFLSILKRIEPADV